MADASKERMARRSSFERRSQQSEAGLRAGLQRERGVVRQAERLRDEFHKLETAEAAASTAAERDGDLPRPQRRYLARWRQALEGRELRLLARDDDVVREVLGRKGELQAIYSAEGTQHGDELLWFALEHLGLGPALAAATSAPVAAEHDGKEVKRREMFPPLVMNLLSVLARSFGLHGSGGVKAGLLADARHMRLLGFNALEVQHGVTSRSVERTGMTRDEQHRFIEADAAGPVRAREPGPRGALSSQTLAQWEQDLPADVLVGLFNAMVRGLVEHGAVGKKVRAVVDSTLLEVPESFEGAGQTSRTVKVKSKARRPASRKVTIRGFKLWVLMDVESGLPLAFALDTVEQPENAHVEDLVAQARANLGAKAELVGLVLDRGFMDGDLLWKLSENAGLEWVVPAKSNMLVHAEATERVNTALRRHAEPGESALQTARRLASRVQQTGDVRLYERDHGPGRAPLVVAEVEDLQDTAFYGPGGAGHSRVHSKRFRATRLHATVVLSWPDRHGAASESSADDDDNDDGGGKQMVLLSATRQPPLRRYRCYDDRSLIENGIFRNGKQHFALGSSTARNAKSLLAGVVFSLIALALDIGLRAHQVELAERSDRRAERLGVMRYRREMEYRNRGMIIIVAADCYTVMPLTEFAAIAGFPGVVVLA